MITENEDTEKEHGRGHKAADFLDSLHDDLMMLEAELEDQLDENIKAFEQTITTHVDQFIQTVEENMATCRKEEDKYFERISSHLFHLLDKVPLEDMVVEVTPELREMFKDKDSLTDILADCHAAHINAFDSVADVIRHQAKSWLSELLENLQKTHVEDRRRTRIMEIICFVENQKEELDNI
ncbi:unnamed protein product [Mesocestoides corti]|uniref:Uncharacterized protein n=1 Tax=Mesocestoides corti TaxID=53468 RepID=A0A3P6I9A5_MESCO|nr:unnamed protein product [Mesocestoides corti]